MAPDGLPVKFKCLSCGFDMDAVAGWACPACQYQHLPCMECKTWINAAVGHKFSPDLKQRDGEYILPKRLERDYVCDACLSKTMAGTGKAVPNCRMCASFVRNLYVPPGLPAEMIPGRGMCSVCWVDGMSKCGGENHTGESKEVHRLSLMGLQLWNKVGELKYYCSSCVSIYRRCDRCNRHFREDEVPVDKRVNMHYFCPGCIEGMEFCADCGRYYYPADMEMCGCGNPIGSHDQNPLSTLAFQSPPEHTSCIVNALPFGKHLTNCKFNDLFFGVELEIEINDKCQEEQSCRHRMLLAKQIRKLLPGFAMVKRDGSLTNGFEIVSAPSYLERHYTGWDALFAWQDRVKMLLSQSTPTCGLHVHVSRRPLTNLQIGKVVNFIHLPGNLEFIKLISGRDAGMYQDFKSPKLWKTAKQPAEYHYSVKADTANRYTAINLANSNTVEFRIFKGTLKRRTFLARLQFCDAILAWAKDASILGLEAKLFLDFLQRQPSRWRFLYDHLADAGQVPKLSEAPAAAEVK